MGSAGAQGQPRTSGDRRTRVSTARVTLRTGKAWRLTSRAGMIPESVRPINAGEANGGCEGWGGDCWGEGSEENRWRGEARESVRATAEDYGREGGGCGKRLANGE